jgi:hypothetical protein
MSNSGDVAGASGDDGAAAGPPATTGTGPSSGAMIAIAVVLGVVAIALIVLAIHYFSIDHTKRGIASVLVAVLAVAGGGYALVKSRQA